jgi:hypothetical protein
MGGDGAEQAEESLKPEDKNALDALHWHWGDAYEIEAWRARRRDGLGGWIEADGPDKLGALIAEDYAVKAVPRDATGTRA